MSEDNSMDSSVTAEPIKTAQKVHKKRDIFRFKGPEEMSLCLDHVHKITRKEKRITFQFAATADFVDFENEEAAEKGYDQIIGVWSADVLE